MASINDITGDSIQTKATTKDYRDNYDRIFGKKVSQDTEEALEEMVDFAQENGMYDTTTAENPMIKKTQ